MNNTKSKVTAIHGDIFQQVAKGGRIALVYHLQVSDSDAYNNWFGKSTDLLESMAGNRPFNMSVDPAPRDGGKPIGILIGDDNSMLADDWSKFILVYYPQRRNLLAMIEGDEFKSGQRHRDAGLERVAIFMGNDKRAVST